MFSAVAYCGFASQHFISIKNEPQVGGGSARLCSVNRWLYQELSHWLTLHNSHTALFAASGGGQAFRNQQVLHSSFPFHDEEIVSGLIYLSYKSREPESALHGILVNLELLHCLCWNYVRLILRRNKTELSLDVKKIVEDVAFIPSVGKGSVHYPEVDLLSI